MINEIKTLIESIEDGNLLRPLFPVEYEENRMMNLKADEKTLESAFAYIEEFTQGTYERNKYVPQKTTQVQIYFCRFGEFQTTAVEREAIRSQIESEIIFPFMEKYNACGTFDRVDSWKFYTPLPRFDANEISIMLQFNCKQNF
jgi:hypothetical protein